MTGIDWALFIVALTAVVGAFAAMFALQVHLGGSIRDQSTRMDRLMEQVSSFAQRVDDRLNSIDHQLSVGEARAGSFEPRGTRPELGP